MLKVVKENYFSTVKHQFLLCFLKKNASHRTNDLENFKLKQTAVEQKLCTFLRLKEIIWRRKKKHKCGDIYWTVYHLLSHKPFDLQLGFSPFFNIRGSTAHSQILLPLTEIQFKMHFPWGEKAFWQHQLHRCPTSRAETESSHRWEISEKKQQDCPEGEKNSLFTYHIKTQVWDPDAAIWTWWHHC